MTKETSGVSAKEQRGCNVNSTFNFTVGRLAIAATLVIAHLAYMYWWK